MITLQIYILKTIRRGNRLLLLLIHTIASISSLFITWARNNRHSIFENLVLHLKFPRTFCPLKLIHRNFSSNVHSKYCIRRYIGWSFLKSLFELRIVGVVSIPLISELKSPVWTAPIMRAVLSFLVVVGSSIRTMPWTYLHLAKNIFDLFGRIWQFRY